MRCEDCGADISDRGRSAYLCRPCRHARELIGNRRRYRELMADPTRAAARRAVNAALARRRYVPVKHPKTTVEPCRAVGCKKTWVRVWHATNRIFCDDCRAFYNRETELDYWRRRRKTHEPIQTTPTTYVAPKGPYRRRTAA